MKDNVTVKVNKKTTTIKCKNGSSIKLPNEPSKDSFRSLPKPIKMKGEAVVKKITDRILEKAARDLSLKM